MACSLAVVSGMAFEARIASADGIQLVYGLNPAKLEADMEQAIHQGATGLLSFGTAAGLLPSLSAGAIVIATSVLWQDQQFATDAAWTARLQSALPDVIAGMLAGVEQPLATIEQKSSLWKQSGAIAADMESQQVARIAQRHRLPFAVLRVVLDNATCALPPAALVATRSDGSIDYARLLASLMTHPQQLPAMLRLGADHKQAKKALLRVGDLKRSLFCMDVR